MLPKGWVNADLIDIITLHDSKRIPLNSAQRRNKPGNYAYYGANGQVDSVGEYIFDGEYILLAEDGGFFDQPQRGVAYQVSGKFWVNNHAHILTPKGEIPYNYLCKALNHFDWMTVVSGTTRLKLTQGNMRQVKVPLPPLAEQRRIVAKLDSLSARIARARAELERIQVLKVHLRRQALHSCFADLEKHKLPLGELLQGIEAGKNMRCVERPPVAGEKGVVKVSAVTWGRFDATQTKTLPNDYLPPTKARIMKGDLLISRANTLELVGAAVIVDVQPDNIFLSDKILRLIVDKNKKSWILWYLRSPEGRSQIESLATGNQLSMRNISQAALRQIKIPLPEAPIRQQRLTRLTAAIKTDVSLEAEAQRALTLLHRLESSLLTKAFQGKLVPQNPTDEPASVLLDRIRTERAAAPKPKRRRKA